MNTNNDIVRIIYAMSREGMLPAKLATVHPVHRTPTNAIWLQAVSAVVLTFGVGLLAGPFNTYVYLGSILTLAIIPVYMLTNLACVRHAGPRRAERSIVRHVVLPVAGILLLLIPIYGQVYPVPAAPLAYFPYLVLVAAAVMWATKLGRTRPDVLCRAGAVLATRDADVDAAVPQEALGSAVIKRITLSVALQLVSAAHDGARQRGVKVSAAVVDNGNHLLALGRMDGAEIAGPTANLEGRPAGLGVTAPPRAVGVRRVSAGP